MNNEASPSNEFLQLEPGSEWRFELEAEESIAIRVSGDDYFFHFICFCEK